MKQRKYFFMVLSLFPLIPLAAWLFGPGTSGYKVVSYSVAFIFLCYWLWSALYIARGNTGFFKKIKDSKGEKEK